MWQEYPASPRSINNIYSLFIMLKEFIKRDDSEALVDYVLKNLPQNSECVLQGQILYSKLISFTNSISQKDRNNQLVNLNNNNVHIPKLPLIRQPNPLIRVFIDGVFDFLHSGHLNALRQAKNLGHVLVVGVNSDDEVEKAKGMRPIYNENERMELLKGCKWVDEIIIGTPYSITPRFLDEVAKCNFATHGDDIAVNASGVDVYKECREADRLKIFKRTRGVSSSTTLKRLLDAINVGRFSGVDNGSQKYNIVNEESLIFPKYCLSSDRLLKFMEKNDRYSCSLCESYIMGSIDRSIGKRVVYIDGCFDIFHLGHLSAIEAARSMGDYLIVGLYDDEIVKSLKGESFPFTNLLERALTLLAMKNVDEVILGAPYVITKSFLKGLKVDLVACGHSSDMDLYRKSPDPYAIPREMGILHYFDSGSVCNIIIQKWTTKQIIERISSRGLDIIENVEKRVKKEEMFYRDKDGDCYEID